MCIWEYLCSQGESSIKKPFNKIAPTYTWALFRVVFKFPVEIWKEVFDFCFPLKEYNKHPMMFCVGYKTNYLTICTCYSFSSTSNKIQFSWVLSPDQLNALIWFFHTIIFFTNTCLFQCVVEVTTILCT